MKFMTINPKRGEIWLINLEPTIVSDLREIITAIAIIVEYDP
jgi:hypothetical protein